MSAHSSIGPSAAERWLACPASVPMSAKCPPQPTSYTAAEGSVAHKLAEQLLRGEVDEMGLMARIGDVVKQDGQDVTIIEEMVEGARLYKETVDADYLKLCEDGKPATIQRLIEQRVDLKSIDPDLWGTADYLLFQKGHRLTVYDYKFGQGKAVSPTENAQAGLYGLGAMESIAGTVFDEVELVIVQPRAGGVKRWVAPHGWLALHKQRAASAIKESRGPNPTIKAGDHCRWCPAQSVCPEVGKRVAAAVQADFTALAPSEAEIKTGELRGLPDVQLLGVEQMAQALDWEDAIVSWFGALRARAQRILEEGGNVPGYKLVDGRSNRQWADGTGEAAATHFAPKFGHRVYAPKKPLSVAQMEKLVGKGGLPGELVVKPEAAKKLAPSDDPRPVASSSAQQDFDPLGQDPLGVPAPTEDPLLEVAAGRETFWP